MLHTRIFSSHLLRIVTEVGSPCAMGSPSPERGRSRTRSHTPTAAKARSPPRDQSPRRSISPRSASRSRTPTRSPSARGKKRQNGLKGGRSRSRSPSRTPSRSRSGGRGERNYRDRSYTRSASPVPRSSKVCQQPHSLNKIKVDLFADCSRKAHEERPRGPSPGDLWRIRLDS